MSSTSRPNVARNQSQRLPAPSLFVGPPSRNASNTSLLPPPTTGVSTSRAPLTRMGDRNRGEPGEGIPTAGTSGPTDRPFGRRQQQQHQQVEQQSNDRTDAIWAEMQNTLEEVELSAVSGTHIFGTEHSKALEALRTSQIALAQAWARSEADEELHEEEEKKDAAAKPVGTSSVLASDRAEKLNTSSGTRPRSGTNQSNASARTQLEEDTENDILLARKRREANDRYFQRVNAGVLDVVAKLEEVAKSMKAVEQESKEIWGDNESLGTASFTSK
ncbi:hypothetical protein K490DRAFT_45308 [Saccharata proteae CBS 121410]|uniref:Uncharacterized protein n=1 Tax=Saccharata proteae CBS 121410 TaxID=1314787 RepID=A0A9P4LTY0_9PEZI|nr:hypothetical protein K490DRAFT_45308 [Saccharata proteae CBS 121410]